MGRCNLGYAQSTIESNTVINIPKFANAKAGDTVAITLENGNINMYFDFNYEKLINGISVLDKKDAIPDLEGLLNYCKSLVSVTSVNSDLQVDLSQSVELNDQTIELIGDGKKLIMIGNINVKKQCRN